jgi:trans-aconitate methyltransferase
MTNTFNKVANIYSQARPGYPEELYKRIADYKTFNQKSLLLEIGAGHGIATEEINTYWNPNIIAIEPGEELYKLAKQRLVDFTNIHLVNCTFENYDSSKIFDGIYSATAFHWIDKSIKFKKAYQLLNENGLLFLFWNNYSLKDTHIFNEIQKIYHSFHPHGAGKKDIRIILREKIQARRKEVEESNYFKLLSHDEISHTIIYSANRYVKLLQSFSDNAFPKSEIDTFYEKIHKSVLSYGNKIELEIVVNLEIAKKSI